MNVKELLLKAVATQYGISEEAAADLLFEKSEEGTDPVLKKDALATLNRKDQERVATIKEAAADTTEAYNKAYADAKKEILPKAEKRLAKKYGIDGENFKLETLVDDIIAKQTEGLKGDPNTLDEDTVKKHPAYITLERSRDEAIEALKTEHEETVQGIKAGYAKEALLGTVVETAAPIFDNLKPILPATPAKAARQRQNFLDGIKARYEWQRTETGDFVAIDPATNKRIEDGHGNAMTFDKLVARDAALDFDFAVQDPKGGAGNEGGADGGITVPTNEEEYLKAALNATTAEERASIDAAYQGTQD